MKQFVIGLAAGAIALALLQHATMEPAAPIEEPHAAAAQALGGDCGPCPADLNDSGAVDVQDMLILLSAWGACPDCAGPEDCDDGNPCTIDQCVNGTCVHTQAPAGTACDDGDPCTISVCNAAGICVSSPIPNCCQDDLDCGPNQQCVNGSCACLPGFMDCDGNPANGCEVDTTSDPLNCGGCGIVCEFGDTCQDSQCVTLQTWYLDLDADTWGDCDDFILAPAPSGAYTATACGDCDDTNPQTHPGAIEICEDSIDNDCNGFDEKCP